MIRSMWSAVSGLRNHQIFLDVTGNNIANVNTHGYKAGRAIFEDSLSQIVRGASAPVTDPVDPTKGVVGGTNPAQIGLGVRLGAITNVFTQGGAQVTNLTTDCCIQGDGFFQVKKGDVTYYTRNGAFNFDSDGFLVTSDGSYVMGLQYQAGVFTPAAPGVPASLAGNDVDAASPDGRIRLPRAWGGAGGDPYGWTGIVTPGGDPVSLQSFQITPDGKLVGTFTDDSRRTFGQIQTATFNNPPGLEKVGGTLFSTTNNSGSPIVGNPRSDDRGSILSGTLEMSNVDLAAEFTNLIVAQRGFQANSRVITASDEVLQDLVNMKR